MDELRARTLKGGKVGAGPVVYWMSRDQRARDNWALIYAQDLAIDRRVPLLTVFCLVPQFLGATIRHYGFMLKGLHEVADSLVSRNIPFFLLQGNPVDDLPRFVEAVRASALVTDFDPLRIKRAWKNAVASKIDTPFIEVDAHNIVPCWVASDKQEFAARTLRPKIRELLPRFLTEFPSMKHHPFPWKPLPEGPNWSAVERSLKVDRSVAEVTWLKPGEQPAGRALRDFVGARLEGYSDRRNDPTEPGQSNLSPYLHFGHLSAQKAALLVRDSDAQKADKDAFLEELIVRRELSDNFCFYNQQYDSVKAFPDWARHSHDKHRRDRRKYTYSLKQLENSMTHDDLWNAAQLEMVKRGKMHGYLRMYWAKKILEWTRTPEDAMKIAIYLNDRYSLDGRDPNGYTGIAWSIGGVHDRAWAERPVFGKIRFMSYAGCKAKFDIAEYVDYVASLR